LERGLFDGEEPYSIAITIADSLSFAESWNVEILATDVGRHALKHAERAIYTGRSIGSVSEKQLAAHFVEVGGDIRFGRGCARWFLLHR